MPAEILTIGDIVATVSLDTAVLAGGSGSEREVLWAHSCEMSDPAQWLGPHELLMTVGLCVPADAPGQVELIRRLDDAGLAGMMIGDHDPAPRLSEEMLEEANRRGFPVLLVGPQIPYAVIARHVAAANSSAQTQQVLTLSKLYHLAAYSDGDSEALIPSLSTLLGVGVEVTEDLSHLQVLAAHAPGQDRPDGRTQVREYTLKGRHAARLRLTEFDGEELDSFLLVHLMKVLEVTLDRILDAADRRSEKSFKLALGLLNGVVSAEVQDFLGRYLASDGFQIVAFEADDGPVVARIVSVRELPILVGSNREYHLALVPLDAMPRFEELARPLTGFAGVSSTFTDFADARVAAVEAGRVLAAARHSAAGWTRFEGVAVSVLTRSRREADEIVAGVLGPLATQSSRTDALRETLFAYLRNDRRWTETSAELGIHRQTLSYRLRRIEEETSLDLTTLPDLSAAWIAFQAWEATRAV